SLIGIYPHDGLRAPHVCVRRSRPPHEPVAPASWGIPPLRAWSRPPHVDRVPYCPGRAPDSTADKPAQLAPNQNLFAWHYAECIATMSGWHADVSPARWRHTWIARLRPG